jgi:hypothetical protein
MAKNVSKFNQQLLKIMKHFAQTFLSPAMLNKAGPLIIFCK